MDLEVELIKFANYLVYDVYEYFRRNVCNDYESLGYSDPRCPLYSKFGQLTIIQYLNDIVSKEQVTSYLIVPNLPEIDDIDNVFDITVANILAKSERGHAAFYKKCANIAASGILALKNDRFTVNKIYITIVEYARQAYHSFILDTHYDDARRDAQSFLYTFYMFFEDEITQYFTPIDNAIGYYVIRLSDRYIRFIFRNLPLSNRGIRDFLDGSVVENAKFDDLGAIFVKGFLLDPTIRMSNTVDNFSYLIFYYCFISAHYQRFENGIQNAIESIAELIIMEKNHKIIRSLSSDSLEQ